MNHRSLRHPNIIRYKEARNLINFFCLTCWITLCWALALHSNELFSVFFFFNEMLILQVVVMWVCSIFVSVNVLVMFWFQWFFLFLLLLFLQDCTCETVCYVFICKHFDCELAYKWIWGWLLPFSQVIKILRLYIVFFTGILFYSLPSLGCTYSGCYRWLFWVWNWDSWLFDE